MSLKEEVKTLRGRKRRFILLRIADMDVDPARALCKVGKGTYNSWLKDDNFVSIYRRRDELNTEYKKEAINLLRRDNQLEAVLLEEKIILKMKEEIDSGEYNLIRTHLAREVYSKLISELDIVPQIQALSWEQRIQQLFVDGEQPQQVIEGEVTDVPELIEATGS